MIMDPAIARKIAAIEGRRRVYLRNVYKLTTQPNLFFLRVWDLVTLNESKIGIEKLPVRITKIKENAQRQLEIEAEQFFYALHAPQVLDATVVQGYNPNISGVPADVNAPIFLEPPLRMCLSGKPELWIVVSDSDPDYGGSIANASTDGGGTYPNLLGTIEGNATTGKVTADFPVSNDPDVTNVLSVDLTESLGTLPANSAVDEDAFMFPCYLASTPLYELCAIKTPTLTGPSLYDVGGSGGNPIRRSVFGMPTAGVGVDHPINSRFAWLDNRENNTPNGILKIILDPTWIGKTIFFKFQQFNNFGSGVADLSAVTAYSYTPQGIASGTGGAGSGGGSGGSTGQPPYSITGGALTQPTPTTIHMDAAKAIFPGSTAYYDARTFTIPAPTVPTTYYVTIHDPGQTGDVGATPTLTSTCQTSNALVGVPGEVYIGSIVALPAGGGTETTPGGFPGGTQISFNGV